MIYSRAPFIYDAWHNPEVLAKLSQVAGLDLVTAIDYEIANINISINDETEEIYHVEKPNDDVSAFAWHFDSFPFVCVMMLSDCTGMVGGETALKTSSGEIMKVRGPAMVCPRYSFQYFLGRLTDPFVGHGCHHARPIY